MADEEKKEEAAKPKKKDGDAKPKRSKKGLFLGGGAIAVIATAAIVSMMAVPSDGVTPTLGGPFVMDLAALEDGQALTANLAGEGGRRYLVIDLKVEYDAYEERYGFERIADPLYIAKLQDTLLTVASQRTAEDVLERGTQEIFLAELREAAERLLFPVHVGNHSSPTGTDERSGLRPGLSIAESTLREPFHEGELIVDSEAGTVQLGEGEKHTFKSDDSNLLVRDEQGRTVYVDMTGLKPEFSGLVKVGVKGRVRQLYKVKFIIQ
jgi:flagellar basal body-associated protein FliL